MTAKIVKIHWTTSAAYPAEKLASRLTDIIQKRLNFYMRFVVGNIESC